MNRHRVAVSFRALVSAATLWVLSINALATTYESVDTFVQRNFDDSPEVQVAWLTSEVQEVATEILGHRYGGLRVRYWENGQRTAWVLDEIGKEKPITIGVVVDDDQIVDVSILAFRESRGGEVRHPFFTRQFMGLGLTHRRHLTGNVDGITGATMSVSAVTNIARFALYLHEQTREK